MWLQRVALGIAGIVGVGIIVIGVRFLLVPVESAAGYGLPALAADDPYLAVKGVRDIGSGLVLLTVFAMRKLDVLGWAMLAASVMPLGDALVVLAHGGPAYAVYGIHGATAVAMMAAAAVLISGRVVRPAPRGSAVPVH